MGTNKLMRRTKREKETDQIWAREEEKHKTQEDRTDITPPSRTALQRGGGGHSGASRDTETGQDRRPPGPAPVPDPRQRGELGRPWRVIFVISF